MSCLYVFDIKSVDHIVGNYYLLFHRLSFLFVDGFLSCAKVCKFN